MATLSSKRLGHASQTSQKNVVDQFHKQLSEKSSALKEITNQSRSLLTAVGHKNG